MRIPSILLVIVLATSLPALLVAEAEKTGEVKTYTLYVLAENSGEAETFAVEKMYLPSTVSFYGWTRFTVRGSEVSTEASAEYAAISRQQVSSVRAGGLLVLAYRIGVAVPEKAGEKAKSSVNVKFSVKDCRDAKGRVTAQPARLSLVRAVTASKKKSGFARVAELSYLGSGRFSARVELR